MITDIYIFNNPKCSTHFWSVVIVLKVYFHVPKCTFHPDLILHQKWNYMDPCLNLLIICLCNLLFIEYLYLWIKFQLNIFIHEFPIIDEIFLYPMNVLSMKCMKLLDILHKESVTVYMDKLNKIFVQIVKKIWKFHIFVPSSVITVKIK